VELKLNVRCDEETTRAVTSLNLETRHQLVVPACGGHLQGRETGVDDDHYGNSDGRIRCLIFVLVKMFLIVGQ